MEEHLTDGSQMTYQAEASGLKFKESTRPCRHHVQPLQIVADGSFLVVANLDDQALFRKSTRKWNCRRQESTVLRKCPPIVFGVFFRPSKAYCVFAPVPGDFFWWLRVGLDVRFRLYRFPSGHRRSFEPRLILKLLFVVHQIKIPITNSRFVRFKWRCWDRRHITNPGRNPHVINDPAAADCFLDQAANCKPFIGVSMFPKVNRLRLHEFSIDVKFDKLLSHRHCNEVPLPVTNVFVRFDIAKNSRDVNR